MFDGSSISLFMKTLSAFARGDTGSISAPFFDRSLLRARSPPSVSFDHSDYTLEVHQYSNINQSNTSSEVLYAKFIVTKDQVRKLKIHAGGQSVSTYCVVVVAHVGKCICIARGLASDVETQLFFPIDLCRRRMKPPLPLTYIGNGILRNKIVVKVEELTSNKLEFGASLIKKADITDEFARSLIDHLESMDLEALSKRGSMSKTAVMATSWLSFPMNGVDYGWGEPILVARAQLFGSGYVYLTKAPAMNDGISLTVGLEPDSLRCFKKLLSLYER